MTELISRADHVFDEFLDNMPDQTTCEAQIATIYGAECNQKATVSDVWSELQFCGEHYRALQRGTL